jgi:hypothetical protein
MKRCSAKTLSGERCSRNANEECKDGKCKQHSTNGTKDVELIKIEKANDGVHKYVAYFNVNGKEKHTFFGAVGYTDFTIHKDYDHRDLYIQRHKKDLNTKDMTRAGALSMYVLWNYPTFSASVKDYKRRIKEKDFSLPKGYKR